MPPVINAEGLDNRKAGSARAKKASKGGNMVVGVQCKSHRVDIAGSRSTQDYASVSFHQAGIIVWVRNSLYRFDCRSCGLSAPPDLIECGVPSGPDALLQCCRYQSAVPSTNPSSSNSHCRFRVGIIAGSPRNATSLIRSMEVIVAPISRMRSNSSVKKSSI